jgi:hypothetical protein
MLNHKGQPAARQPRRHTRSPGGRPAYVFRANCAAAAASGPRKRCDVSARFASGGQGFRPLDDGQESRFLDYAWGKPQTQPPFPFPPWGKARCRQRTPPTEFVRWITTGRKGRARCDVAL